jgi:hypothetical protein
MQQSPPFRGILEPPAGRLVGKCLDLGGRIGWWRGGRFRHRHSYQKTKQKWKRRQMAALHFQPRMEISWAHQA